MCSQHALFHVSLLTWGGQRDEAIQPAHASVLVWQQEGWGSRTEVRMLTPGATPGPLTLRYPLLMTSHFPEALWGLTLNPIP